MAAGFDGTEHEFAEDEARDFWMYVRERVEHGQLCFRGWYFPEDPDETFFGEEATFDGDADFSEATFDGYADFSNAMFDGYADFRKAKFKGYTDFWHANFTGYTDFRRAKFKEYVNFTQAEVEGDADFRRATFEEEADFREATFTGRADFLTTESKTFVYFTLPMAFDLIRRKHYPFCLPEEGATAYRLAKQTAQDRGDYREAGDYHYAEECAVDRARLKQSSGLAIVATVWRVLWGQMVFGYGERPLRPLGASVFVILLCSAFYRCGGIVDGVEIDPKTQEVVRDQETGREKPREVSDWTTSLYFSTVTFTTLGYGDLRPPPGRMRLVAGVEALLGMCLMALFVVCLARRFAR